MTHLLPSPVETAAIACDPASARLAEIVRTALGPCGFAAQSGGRGLDAAPSADIAILVFDLQNAAEAIRAQDRALRLGTPVLPIGEEPGAVWIGPQIAPGAAGCLACLSTWVANNRRLDQHWSARRGGNRKDAQQPLSPAAADVLARLVEAAVHEPRPGTVTVLDVDRLTVSRHGFVADPDCPSCAARPADSAELARLDLLPRIRAEGQSRAANPKLDPGTARATFVDRTTGLLKHVFHDVTSSLLPMYAAEMPILGAAETEVGYGRTETRRGSELVAILEALERFAGHRPRRTRPSVRGSYREVTLRYGDSFVSPETFVLHRPEQAAEPGYHLAPYDADLEFDWSWAFSLRRRRPVLIPAQLGWYRLGDDADRPVNRFVYDSSSGCAMGGSVEEAALHGLYEVVERDAYLTSWFARIPPRRIDTATIRDRRARALIARSEAEGLEVHLFDMRLDIDLPAVLGMLVDPAADAAVKSYCASAAHGRWDQAVFSALVEITTSIAVYRHSMPALRDRARALWRDASLVQDMPDHVLLYSVPESFDRLRFLLAGPTVSLADCERDLPSERGRNLTAELEAQVAKVLATANDVIVVDQTFDALGTLGLRCVKVLAPGLTPVTFGHQHRRMDFDRLSHAAASRGLAGLHFGPDTVNPHPHNFP